MVNHKRRLDAMQNEKVSELVVLKQMTYNMDCSSDECDCDSGEGCIYE